MLCRINKINNCIFTLNKRCIIQFAKFTQEKVQVPILIDKIFVSNYTDLNI